uniref:Uncharacterized protein n=1 Tax=Vibrio ordalii TaxID=28174 RepID=A0A0H3ZPN7_9VIBR|nr:hypothetical protein [Vibrio ordalii]
MVILWDISFKLSVQFSYGCVLHSLGLLVPLVLQPLTFLFRLVSGLSYFRASIC